MFSQKTIKHKGDTAQVVPVKGGTLTVKPGKTISHDHVRELTEEQVEHYKRRGVFFSEPSAKRKGRTKGPANSGEGKGFKNPSNPDPAGSGSQQQPSASHEDLAASVKAAEEALAKAVTDEEKAAAASDLEATRTALSPAEAAQG